MYVKTQWVDNTTPIDKDNLNKIEQGIYNNSLVVDAVTNTLNPTDTETYKTAELTEGQITDVIGVNDIVIKGQTSQDGTPTSSSPVDVNVVSGSNVINIYNNQTLSKELPLDLGSIELCKIGNYQDYFYKSGSKWYLHKEIGKVVLNGTEGWGQEQQSGFYRYFININAINNSSLANNILIYSSHFKGIAFNNRNSDTNNTIYTLSNGQSSNRIFLNVTNITSLADFKTWLASNNVTVYYVLITATDTEITDTNLIPQLEAIYNAPLYEQTNITQANNDLPMVLDITACKDNINGIKAFIRK